MSQTVRRIDAAGLAQGVLRWGQGTVEIFPAGLKTDVRACTVTRLGPAKGRPRRSPGWWESPIAGNLFYNLNRGGYTSLPNNPKPHGAPGYLAAGSRTG